MTNFCWKDVEIWRKETISKNWGAVKLTIFLLADVGKKIWFDDG